jgi:NADPH:quinone reductase-like Zn-dependent oxidoreductase
MKRIAIFGATGGVGLHVTELALEKGATKNSIVKKDHNINLLAE